MYMERNILNIRENIQYPIKTISILHHTTRYEPTGRPCPKHKVSITQLT